MAVAVQDAGTVDDAPSPSNFTLVLGMTALVADLSFYYTTVVGLLVGIALGSLTWVAARAELRSLAIGDGTPGDRWNHRKARTSLALGATSTVFSAVALVGVLAIVFWWAATEQLNAEFIFT